MTCKQKKLVKSLRNLDEHLNHTYLVDSVDQETIRKAADTIESWVERNEFLENWIELAERTLKDHSYRLDANRAEDFGQGIRETREFLKKVNKGE